MKMLSIAIKDLWRSFRSYFALAFMFGVPILMTIIFSFLFGGTMGDEEGELSLPPTDVILVDQDEGNRFVAHFEYGDETVDTMGEMLALILSEENFADIMSVTTSSEVEARSQVDSQKAGMAIIIPPDFSAALSGQTSAEVKIEFYKDPDLSLGPQIIQSIVMGIVDGFSSTTISIETVLRALNDYGVTLDSEESWTLIQTLTQNSGYSLAEKTSDLKILSTGKIESEKDQENFMSQLLHGIMGGMMIFFAFYTGASSAQTILQEEEQGTLARLFISPTNSHIILNGKFLTGFLMVIVQVVVLMIFSNLVFNIQWGPFLLVAVFSIGLVMLSNSFGILIMSLVKNTQQAGILYGGVLTFTGMLGISNVFTSGTPIEETFRFLPLLVPQGWAMRTLDYASSANLEKTLLFGAVMIILSVVFFLIGNARFRKRFA